MNYQESKKDITPAQNDTPALLTNLKNRLSALTAHDMPFFLMPVRLETRFMKVTKNLLLENELTPITTRDAFSAAKAFTTSLQALKAYKGFQGVDAGAWSTELKGEALNLHNAFDHETLSHFSRSGLESAHEAMNTIQEALGAVQQNIQAQPIPGSDIPLFLSGLHEASSLIQAKAGEIQERLDNEDYNNSWQTQVSPEFRDQLNGWQQGTLHDLSQQIVNQPENIDAYHNYEGKVSAFLNFLKSSAPSMTLYDKEYFTETFRPIFSEQFSAINTGMENLDENRKAEVAPLVYRIRQNTENSFLSLWLGSGDRVRTERISLWGDEPEIFPESPDTTNLPNELNQLGVSIGHLEEGLDRLKNRLFEGENAEAPEPDLQAYSDHLHEIALLLREAPLLGNQKERNYLYTILKPVDSAIDALFEKADKQPDKTDQTGFLLSKINNQGFEIGYQLNERAQVDFAAVVPLNFTKTVEELWIRVYPDDIAISSHEKKLTDDEVISGQEYWSAWSLSYGNPDIQLKAWQKLAATYGPERAAWIVKATTPANLPVILASFSSVYQLYPQFSTLNTYTVQLSQISLGQSGQTILSNPQWELFVPTLDSVSNKIQQIRTLPQPELIQLKESFESFSGNFNQLAENARRVPPLDPTEPELPQPEGRGENREGEPTEAPGNPIPPVKPFHLEDTIQEIRGKMDLVGSQISSIPITDRWPVVDPPQIPLDEPTKAGNFTEAAYSNVLPDRFLFATVSKHSPDSSHDPVADPLFGSYRFGHIKIGNKIPAKLPTGIDPVAGTYALDALGQLQIDPQIKWMFDFKEAVSVGMGVEIPLVGTEFQTGFDIILALGLKLGESNAVNDSSQLASLGKTLLEDLLDSHHYTPGGLALTEIGAPTNNTDGQATVFGIEDKGFKSSFSTEVQSPLFNYVWQQELTGKRDGQLLAEALGIDHAVFQHIRNAGGKQISDAISMNRALYNGTIGSYMRDMMGFLFTDKNVENTQEYFTDYVLGRGAVPGIRVGKQPYGILPVTSFGRWEWKRQFWGELKGEQFLGSQYASGIDLSSYMVQEYEFLLGEEESSKYFQDRYHIRLDFVMRKLNQTWENISNWHVRNVTNKKQHDQNEFLNILGLEPSMSEAYSQIFTSSKSFIEDGNLLPEYKYKYFNEYSPNVSWGSNNDLPGLLRGLFEDYLVDVGNYSVNHSSYNNAIGTIPSGTLSSNEAERGLVDITDFSELYSFLIKNNEVTNALRIFNTKFLEERFLLYGAKASEINSLDGLLPPYLGGNYITWLKNSSLEAIWKNNRFSAMPSRSLLFLLLRQGVLNTYKESAWDILEKDYVFRKTARKVIGSPEGINLQQQKVGLDKAILTKWHFLFKSLSDLLDTADPDNISIADTVEYFMMYPQNFAHQNWTEYHKNAEYIAGRLLDHYQQTTFQQSSIHGVNSSPIWKEVKLASYLKGISSQSNPTAISALDGLVDWKNIISLQNALTQLSNCKTAELDKLMREHIDLCSYRLDAWNTGKVNKRLWENRRIDKSLPRQARKTGIYLGSYGWLFDVRPKGTSGIQEINAVHLPNNLTNNSGKVYYDPETLGFIQTPSMAHALAAALLRAGYDSEKHQADSRMAVNLSSERVSKAISILEGLHNGQTLNTLIGYTFERGLHENHPTVELDSLIGKLRRLFPQVDPTTSQVVDPNTGQIMPPNATTPANNTNTRANLVINGVALVNSVKSAFSTLIKEFPQKTFYQLYQQNQTAFSTTYTSYASSLALPSLSTQPVEAEAFIQELDKAMDAIDALGDLAVAEGVFQIARGNTDRAGSVLQAWSEGKNPVDPEIVKTPKTGIHIAHRLAVALEKKTASYNPWSLITLTPRAIAEPTINNWVSQILEVYKDNTIPDITAATGCNVFYTDAAGTAYQEEIMLKDLDIQPIDLLFMITQEGFTDELDKRIRAFTRAQFALPTGTPVQIDYGATSTLPIAFSDLHSLLFATQSLLSKARALSADDFMSVTPYRLNAGFAEFDASELQNRVTNLISTLTTLSGQCNSITAFNNNISLLNQVRSMLFKASGFNLPQAVPENAPDDFSDPIAVEDFWKLFISVKESLAHTLNTAINLQNQFTGLTGKALVDKLIETLQVILGDKFLVIPHFSFDKYQNLKSEISASFYPATPVQDILRHHASINELVDDWVFGLSRVNDTAAHIETVRLLGSTSSGAASTTPFAQMRPTQFPYEVASNGNPVYWLGADYPQGYMPKGDRLSVAVFDYAHFDFTSASAYNCGLLLDNWEEVIPDAEITTGITFNYDQPSAQPPQTILLAVNPQVVQDLDPSYVPTQKSWRIEDLLYTLLDTIDLAKMRMVEPDSFRMATDQDKNPYTGNDALVNPDDINGSTNKDAKDTQYFEIFKWILPAVVGEMTPIIDEPYKHYGGAADSVQQVSFDYNPNNDTPPQAAGTTIDPGQTAIFNWDTLSASEVLINGAIQDFLQEQERLGELVSIQQELKTFL